MSSPRVLIEDHLYEYALTGFEPAALAWALDDMRGDRSVAQIADAAGIESGALLKLCGGLAENDLVTFDDATQRNDEIAPAVFIRTFNDIVHGRARQNRHNCLSRLLRRPALAT